MYEILPYGIKSIIMMEISFSRFFFARKKSKEATYKQRLNTIHDELVAMQIIMEREHGEGVNCLDYLEFL